VPLATLLRPARGRGSGNNGVAGTALRPGRPVLVHPWLIDPSALGRGLGWLVLSLVLVAIAKTLGIFILARISRLPAHPGQLAVGLGQVGEFGFVLATVAVARDVLPGEVYAALLAAVAASIAVSSIAVRLMKAPRQAPAMR
jgi:CPA2 family monovalent cation:H+ antiporter-2